MIVDRLKIFLIAGVLGLFALPLDAEINIGVAIPKQGEIQGQCVRMLDSRLKRAISDCGVSSAQWGDFFLVPTATVSEEEIIETGMSNIYKVQVDLTLGVCQLANDATYGSESWTLKGSGPNREKAMMSAFTNWKGGPQFTGFIEETKKKIEDYFISNRASLLAKAKQKTECGEYEEALAILNTYPSNLDGFSEVLDQINSTYLRLSQSDCSAIMLQARSALAMSDYQEAANQLAAIDAMSPCAEEAKEMQAKIRANIKAEEQEAYARQEADKDRAERIQMAHLNSSERREKARLKAAAEITKAYYQRTQPTYYMGYHIF